MPYFYAATVTAKCAGDERNDLCIVYILTPVTGALSYFVEKIGLLFRRFTVADSN